MSTLAACVHSDWLNVRGGLQWNCQAQAEVRTAVPNDTAYSGIQAVDDTLCTALRLSVLGWTIKWASEHNRQWLLSNQFVRRLFSLNCLETF